MMAYISGSYRTVVALKSGLLWVVVVYMASTYVHFAWGGSGYMTESIQE